MENDIKKKREEAAAQFLRLSFIGRPYGVDEMHLIFQDMRSGLEKDLNPSWFGSAIEKSGTHATKIFSPRSRIPGLSFNIPRQNKKSKIHVSGNGALGSHAKILLRPIAILNESGTESFLERLISGCPHAPKLEKEFENTFGKDALIAVKEALLNKVSVPEKIDIHGENFPVFFLPGPDGADIQASPGGYVDAYNNMNRMYRDMKNKFFEWVESEKEKKKNIESYVKKMKEIGINVSQEDLEKEFPKSSRPVFPTCIKTEISTKMQNAIIGPEGTKTRLFVEFKDMLGNESAGIWQYVNGGSFPRIFNDDVSESLVIYTDLLRRWSETPSHPEAMTKSLDSIAEYLIKHAEWFIEDVLDTAEKEYKEFDRKSAAIPTIYQILSRVNINKANHALKKNETKETVAGALRSLRFERSLTLRGHKND